MFYQKVGEGLARFATEHPEADFGADTPAVNRAEDMLNAEGTAYLAGRSSLERVRDRFVEWKAELLAAR